MVFNIILLEVYRVSKKIESSVKNIYFPKPFEIKIETWNHIISKRNLHSKFYSKIVTGSSICICKIAYGSQGCVIKYNYSDQVLKQFFESQKNDTKFFLEPGTFSYKQFCENYKACNFFAIWLRIYISFLNNLDIGCSF